jgi:hypothetical protein
VNVLDGYVGFLGFDILSTHNLGYVPRAWLYIRNTNLDPYEKFGEDYYYFVHTGTEGGQLYLDPIKSRFLDSYYNAGSYYYSFITFKNRVS